MGGNYKIAVAGTDLKDERLSEAVSIFANHYEVCLDDVDETVYTRDMYKRA